MTQTSSYFEHFHTQNIVTNHDDPKKYISIKNYHQTLMQNYIIKK